MMFSQECHMSTSCKYFVYENIHRIFFNDITPKDNVSWSLSWGKFDVQHIVKVLKLIPQSKIKLRFVTMGIFHTGKKSLREFDCLTFLSLQTLAVK